VKNKPRFVKNKVAKQLFHLVSNESEIVNSDIASRAKPSRATHVAKLIDVITYYV
jgi:hypothetical protein